MNVNAGTTTFFKNIFAIALLFTAKASLAQSTLNQRMVFEGTLVSTITGNPVSLSGKTLNFYISSSTGCYLYGESSTTAGDDQGFIFHRFGSGSAIMSSPNNVFSESIFFGVATGKDSLNATCSVTAADTRVAQAEYPDQNIRVTLTLGAVPYALGAKTLNGKTETDFVQVSSDTNTLLSSGTVGQVLTIDGSGNLTWSNSFISSATITGSLGYTPANSTANLSDLSSSATARTNLGLKNLSTKDYVDLSTSEVSGALSVNNLSNSGVAAGTYIKVTVDAKGRVTSGASLTSNDVTTALGFTPVSSAGVLYKSDNLSGLTSSATARINLGLGSLSTMYYIELGSAAVSGILPVAKGGSQWTESVSGIYYGRDVEVSGTINSDNLNAADITANNISGNFINANNGIYSNEEIVSKNGFRGLSNLFAGDIPLLGLDFTDNTLLEYASGKNLIITNATSEVMRVTASHNVGIGTTTPDAKLTVSGVVASTSGGFRFPDGKVQTGAAPSGFNRAKAACAQGLSSCTFTCGTGEEIISGGCETNAIGVDGFYLQDSTTYVSGTITGWTCYYRGAFPGSASISVAVVCARPPN